MTQLLKDAIKSTCDALGFELRRRRPEPNVAAAELPADFDENAASVIQRVRAFTMTSPERIASLCNAVRYVVESQIPGDVVECGVWRGGSMMAVALELLRLGNSKTLHLFDTFEGMSAPTEVDKNLFGESAGALLANEDLATSHNWAYCPQDEVHRNLASTGYDLSLVRMVKGRVEDTIPLHAPETISLLRLDTDWYESTRHELEHLYPRLAVGGVLIIDDYGHWQGARRAVDEFVQQRKVRLLLNRVDYTGRIGVKWEQ